MSWRAFTVALGGAAVWPLAACAPVATIGPATYASIGPPKSSPASSPPRCAPKVYPGRGDLIEPRHQPRQKRGGCCDSRGEGAAGGLIDGVVLIRNHADNRRDPDDHTGDGTEGPTHTTIVAS
jgi:hypothetical protein